MKIKTYFWIFLLFLSCQKIEEIYFIRNYHDGLEIAKITKKTILLIFDSFCVRDHSSDKMLSPPNIKRTINEKYVAIRLFIDDDGRFPNNEKIGEVNIKIQSEKYKSFTQPTFYIVDNQENILRQVEYCPKQEDFLRFLE